MQNIASLSFSGDSKTTHDAGIAITPPEKCEEKGASATVHAIESTETLCRRDPRYGTLRLLLLWKYELLSMIVSSGALLATVAVLFAFDGKPMTHWRAIAQPNTVVSALSTLAKSSMLMAVGQGLGQLKWQHFEQRSRRLIDFEIFESASRGPWGALEFLYYINWRALVGSTGAIITILAVAMDPFAQQVIQFNSRLVTADNMTSIIGAARNYDMNSLWESSTDGDGQAPSRDTYNKVRDTNVIGAIYQGIFGSDPQMPYDCPSGDCTWEPFESIGICNTCVDVTAATNNTRICEDGVHASWHPGNPLMGRTCHYETPLGYEVNGQASNWEFVGNFEQYHTLWNSTTYWRSTWPRSFGESAPENGIATVAALKFVEYDDTVIASPEVWLESAHECTISWCAKDYDTTISENGHLNDDSRSTPLVFLDKTPCHSTVTDKDSRIPLASFATTGDNITSYLIPGYKLDDLPDLNCTSRSGATLRRFWGDSKAFWINHQDNKNILDALGAMFTTTFESRSRPGDDPARAMFRAESFPATMDRVALSMTNSIRTGPNQTEVLGSVLVAEQHIQVRWPWMMLPAALVLLSVAFLIVSMVMSTRQCAGWKSSALPSFYHGFSELDTSESQPGDIDEMERSARSIYARLGTDDNGRTRLIQANG